MLAVIQKNLPSPRMRTAFRIRTQAGEVVRNSPVILGPAISEPLLKPRRFTMPFKWDIVERENRKTDKEKNQVSSHEAVADHDEKRAEVERVFDISIRSGGGYLLVLSEMTRRPDSDELPGNHQGQPGKKKRQGRLGKNRQEHRTKIDRYCLECDFLKLLLKIAHDGFRKIIPIRGQAGKNSRASDELQLKTAGLHEEYHNKLRPLLHHGQMNDHLGAMAFLAFRFHRAAVGFNDLIADGEAQTHSFADLFCGEERVKDLFEMLGFDARAIVFHRYDDLITGR